jgi:hypothetical protein
MGNLAYHELCCRNLQFTRKSLDFALEDATGKEQQRPQADDRNSQSEQGQPGLDGLPERDTAFQFISTHVDVIELVSTRAPSTKQIRRVAQETASASR